MRDAVRGPATADREPKPAASGKRRSGERPRRLRAAFVATLVAVYGIAVHPGATALAATDDPVTGVAASPGENPGELVIAWDAHPDGPEDYRVSWAPGDENFRGFADLDWNAYTTGTGHTVTGLEPGATYKVRVRARFGPGVKSPWTQPVTGDSAPELEPDPDESTERTERDAVLRNSAPTFTSGSTTPSINENVSVGTSVESYPATDADSDTLTYSLTGTDSGDFAINSSGELTIQVSPDYETKSSYSVTVNVTDGKDSSGNAEDPAVVDASVDVTVSINDLNEKATFNDAGPVTITVNENTGQNTPFGPQYGASDPESDALDFGFSGTDATEFQIRYGDDWVQVRTLAALDHETKSSYSINLTVSDKKDDMGIAESPITVDDTLAVTITVNDVAESPVFNDDLPTTLSVAENISGGSNIGAAFTASDDDDGDTVSYTLVGGGTTFGINSMTGQISLASDASLDHETTASYSLTVTASDGDSNTANVTHSVTVNVTDVDEAGSVTIMGTAEGGETLSASLSDDDDGVTGQSWQWARADSSSGTFTNIDGATSASYTLVAADVGKYLRATVTYTDEHGSGKTASKVTGQIGSANSAPTFNTGYDATPEIDENVASGTSVESFPATDSDTGDTLTYTLTGTDATSFSINSMGQLSIQLSPNYESKSSYSVTVNVRDSKDSAGSADTAVDASIDVTVSIKNLNEDGSVTITGTVQGGQTLSASLTDPDGSISSQSWQWARADSSSGPFTDITTATSAMYTLVAADVNKYLRATTSYTDGHGSGKSANAVTGQVGSANTDPTFNSGYMTTLTVPENSTAGTTVGSFPATDSDTGDTLTFTLTGTDANSFTIDSSGDIKTKTGVTYNYEATKNTYSVTVNVRDSKDAAGNSDTSTDATITGVAINLTNVNEAPSIATGPTSKSIAENTTAVATYTGSDPDANDTLTWSVETADDGSFFSINSSGELSFSAAPNFENKQDANADNDYVVTVKVSDAAGLSATRSVTVTVTNVNEAPTIDSGPTSLNVDENTATTTVIASYGVSDVDANSVLTGALEGEDAGDFTITKNTDDPDNIKFDIRFSAVPDYERPADDDDVDANAPDNVYDFTVKITDNHTPQGSASRDVSVTVNDVNETPVFSTDADTNDTSLNFAEIEFDVLDSALNSDSYLITDGTYIATDDDGHTITWSVISATEDGTDHTHFSIAANDDGDGVLSFNARSSTNNRLDYENPDDDGLNNVYDILIQADDGQGLDTSKATLAVTVTITNVDETPKITGNATPSFAEIEYDFTETPNLVVETFEATDEESETITWSLVGNDASDFDIDNVDGDGVLKFSAAPDFETPRGTGTPDPDNTYELTVRATDQANPSAKSRDFTVTITVTNVNETPEITSPPADRNFAEIEYDFTGTADLDVATFTARDEEGQSITWRLSGDDAGDFTITSNGLLKFSDKPNFEMAADDDSDNVYNVTVEAFDGTNTGSHDYTVTVTDVNEQPELTGTVTTEVNYNENETADVASYIARDEEGGVTWSLTGTDAGDFSIAGGVVTFNSSPNWEDPDDSGGDNVYNFTVVATDVASGSTRRTASTNVEVTVADIEEAGSIEVSNPNPAVGQEIAFTLTDPDGEIRLGVLDITWTLETRSGGGAWSSASVQFTNVPGATADEAVAYYAAVEAHQNRQVRVRVAYEDRRSDANATRDKSAVSTPTAAISPDPIPNAPPRFTNAGDRSISETGAGTDVGDRITATDRDGDTITFGLSDAFDSELFEINASSGQLTTADEVDFESLGGRLLRVSVTIHDGEDADGNVEDPPVVDATHTLSITVLDMEEDGEVTLSSYEPSVGTTVQATLADGDGSLSGIVWQWARSINGRSNWVPISNATSSSYTTGNSDANFYLRARATYTDNRGGGKVAEAFTTAPVFGENMRPTFPATETGQRSVAENTRAGTNIGAPVAATDGDNDSLTYSLTGTDADAFTINAGNGQIRTKDPLDFETKSSYTLTVEVHDRKDGNGNPDTTVDATQAVTITITNQEEPGTVTLTTLTQSVQARVEVTAELADDDGPSGVTWQWQRSPNGRTNWVNIATGERYTPTLVDRQNHIRAIASYNDGEGSGKTATSAAARVGDAPPVNSAPAFPATETGQRSIEENAAAGATVGDPVAANDLDNDTLTYSLAGSDAGSFEIDNSGQIRVAAGADLNFEAKRTYRITVEVTDGTDPDDEPDNNAIDDTIAVTITVTDVNEAPEVAGDTSVTFQENASTAVATYTATDPDRDTLTWSVDNDDFWISDRGRLHFATPPSFENGSNSHQVTVTATDDGGLAGSLGVTVTVTDTEEQGTVTITPMHGWDGTQFSAGLADDDGSPSGVTWQWARSRSRSGGWADIADATSSTYTAGADDIGYYLQATASYSDRRGSNKTASAALAGRIADAADRAASNTAPEFAEADTTRSIGQGTAAGRSIGGPVKATDPDTGDVLTYTLSGPDSDAFEIDPATGQLRTKSVLDPEVQDTYQVTIDVHDGFDSNHNPNDSQDDSIDVVITVSAVAQRSLGGGGGGGGGGAGDEEPEDEDAVSVFADTGGHLFTEEIEWLAEEGITQGCGAEPPRYCPERPVTRAEMATFLTRALDLEIPRQGADFDDVDPSGVHADSIQALFAAGITQGCGAESLRFCGNSPVTRAEMATFLYRALDLEIPRRGARFDDVDPSGVHADSIRALFAAGITQGCGTEPPRFCPERPVTRAEMAAFLYRARRLIAAAS